MNGSLLEVLWAIADPIAVVSREGRVLFASRAFTQLLGHDALDAPCWELFLPYAQGKTGSCCWEAARVLDGMGLWALRGHGGRVPVLCRAYPVRISGKEPALAIKAEPLSFREGRNAPTPQPLLERAWADLLRGFLERSFSPLFACCTEVRLRDGSRRPLFILGRPLPGSEEALDRICEAFLRGAPPAPQDLQVGGSLFHAFPQVAGERALVLLLSGVRREVGALQVEGLVSLLAEGLGALGEGQDAPLGPSPFAPLTDREREVALLLGQGLSDKEIARALSISPLTVRNHVSAIMQKLGVHKRARLAVLFAWGTDPSPEGKG
ncbi:hypothetical protein YIM1640_17400 [Thermus oshimai]|jgi:DNA-binding CsgD family transcriptional regulator